MSATAAAAIGCVVLSVMAQFLIKAGLSAPAVKAALAQPVGLHTALPFIFNPAIIGGFLLYTLGAVAWLSVLARWDVSKAYPLEGLGFALALTVGFAIGEEVTLLRTLGVFLICAGVLVVSAS